MRESYNKLNEAFEELGFEPELDLRKQYAPRPGSIASWYGEDDAAIILGLDEGFVEFIFDGKFKLEQVRFSTLMDNICRYTEPA